MYSHTQKLPYKNVSVFLYTQKILCNPRKKLLVFLPYKNYYVVHPYKNYHTKDCHTFFPYKNYYVVHAQKLPYIFTMYFLPYKNYYVLHAKKSHTKKI